MTALAQRNDLQSPGEGWAHALMDQGWCIIPDLVPRAKIRALHEDLSERFARTPFCQGDFYGARTKRFGGLLKRSPHADAFVRHPTILDIADRVLLPFCDCYQLNLTQALEIHPGSPMQVPHRDQDMWGAATGTIEYLINVMWPMTPYRRENGATVVWPGSHRRQDTEDLPMSDAIFAEMDPGSALLFLGSTLHCAGANTTMVPRAGMIVSYSLGWLKPYENQWLVYPPDVARHFPPELAALVGYRQHRPNLGNYEGQCPSVLLRDGVADYLGAVDELRPDQAAQIKEYMASR
ncbi:MAG TPA: phytanoyl-CoA dioxygenase family protein [Rhizomicrobium sp.]|nr:phytanoyl-CoA dioxygenase family protein [Rhizomicrobium sp.]